MKKKAVLFSAGEYLKSSAFSIPNLSGVKYDIAALEKRLKQIGFDTFKRENLKRTEYIPTLQGISEKSSSDSIYIVYFSGHGGSYNGKNYIFPSDFGALYDISNSIDNAGINLEEIISVFNGKGKLILILDACRCDIGSSKGYYSEMVFSEDVYIAYSSMFQSASFCVDDGMSWFTEAICDEILTPNIDVDSLFTRVRQNIFTKHQVQIPSSVNALLNNVILHPESSYDVSDKQVYDFIQQYGDDYTDKFGYFHGDDLIFIDAAQYFNIGLLDAIWKFKKVDNKVFRDKGVSVPELTEAESKVVSFLGLFKGEDFFYFDESHTWYYNGRRIRMGEIPPLPPSMQQQLPEDGKEIDVTFDVKKDENFIVITTNLPDQCDIFIKIFESDNKYHQKKHLIVNSKITINNALLVSKIVIDSGVFSSDQNVQKMLGSKCRNLIGDYVKYNPITGNHIHYMITF